MNKTTVFFAPGAVTANASAPLWQYDYGQILVIHGLDLPTSYEVQFCNLGDCSTVTQIGGADGVVIPDQFLATGRPVYAYIFLHTGDSDGETEYKITIDVLTRAQPSDIEPTPQQESTIGQLIDALNAAVEAAEEAAEKGPKIVDGFWYTWDAAAGDYVNTNVPAEGEDGAPGNSLWWTVSLINDESMAGQVYGKIRSSWLKGRSGAPAVHDLVVGPAVGTSGSIEWLYEIIAVSGIYANLHGIGSIKGAPGDPGEDGFAPEVTIETIPGGHRVTITDEAHPQGQSFDVMDGQGGSGSSDYADLTNKPSINNVTLSGNKSASDLSLLPTTGNAYRAVSIPMGELDSTSTATVMTAQVDGITELRDGVCVWLKNGVVKSASGVTLNINSLGAKPIYNSLSGAVVTTTFTAASTYLFVYNSTRVTGGCWDMVYGYDTNTSYTPVTLGFGYATCSTAAATAAKTASLPSYTLTTGGIVAVKFTNAVPADATLNINSKGAKAIYYKGAAITAGVIKAGDTVTMIYSTYYHIISIDRDEAPVTSVNGQTGAVSLSIPSTASDVGAVASDQGVANANKVLKVNSSGVVVPEDDRFVVTMTPTAADLSGVMDKTVAEIDAAYDAGKKVLFRVLTGANSYTEVDCTIAVSNGSDTFPSYGGYTIDIVSDILIYAYVPYTSNPNLDIYVTRIYPLATGQWTGGSY